MTPTPGQFFASRSNSFLGKNIQRFEKIQQERMNHYHNEMLWNHIGCFIEVNGILMIGESLVDGFNIHPWVGSEYERGDTDFVVLKLYRDWTKEELYSFTKGILAIKGTPYDFEGIADQIDFCLTGVWKGKKGIEARSRMYCSEAIETIINDNRKGIFPFPHFGNPQMFIENANIVKA
jgi:hypothetical protein